MSHLFSDMFHTIKRMDDFNYALESIPEDKKNDAFPFDLVRLEDNTIALIRALKDNIPFIRSNLTYESKSLQKVRLIYLVERLEELRHTLNTEIQILVPPDQLEKIEVWSFECAYTDAFSVRPWTYSYWGLIISELVNFSRLPKIELQTCEIFSHSKKVTIQLKWHGPFEYIEFLTFPHTVNRFWKPVINSNESAQLSLQATMFSLYLQTVGAWGENEIVPGKVQDGEFTASLQVSQTDFQTDPPLELPLSEMIRTDISNYVIQQFYPSYLELSQKLEKKLHSELERRQKYVERGLLESDAVEQMDRWLKNLVALREAYTMEVSKP